MTNEEIIEKIRTTLAEEFEVDIDVIQPDAPLMETLELDSLDLVDMVVLVEQELRLQRNRTRFCGYQNLPGLLRSRYHPYAGSQVNMSTWKGKTRGGTFGYLFFIYLIKYLGITAAYIFLSLVVLYFVPFAPKATKSTWFYARHILKYNRIRSLGMLLRNYYRLEGKS